MSEGAEPWGRVLAEGSRCWFHSRWTAAFANTRTGHVEALVVAKLPFADYAVTGSVVSQKSRRAAFGARHWRAARLFMS